MCTKRYQNGDPFYLGQHFRPATAGIHINGVKRNTVHMRPRTVTITPERSVYIDDVQFAHRTHDMGVMPISFAQKDRKEK